MLTYNEYMKRNADIDVLMADSHKRESDQVKDLDEERQQQNSKLFEDYVEAKRKNNQDYYEKIRVARDVHKAERRQIFEKRNLLVMEWRAQLLKIERGEIAKADIYDFTPPSDGGGQHDINEEECEV